MEQTWRWYGLDDPVSLANVRQAGAIGVVTTLHHIPNDEVWSVGEILRRETIVEDAGLVWSVVESVPTHEGIKTHTGNYEQWIANYQQTLHNLAQRGIHTICYNFMPVPDWIRTDLEYMLPGGPRALRLDQIEFAAFEMHILKRPGAEADYTGEEIAQTAERFATTSDEDEAHLAHNIIAGLPDAEEGCILDQSRKHLELYKDIGRTKLRGNFTVFLKVIIPITEEAGVRMAVHPNDPPRPILDLPHIVSTIEGMQWMVDTVSSMANGFTVCIGSCDVRADSDLVDMIKQFDSHICFTHLHSTMRKNNPKTFREAAHLNDDVDMYGVVETITREEHRRRAEGEEDLIPMRPGHGHQMLDDPKRKTDPGYFATGRLKGLAEIRGVELAIQHAFFSH